MSVIKQYIDLTRQLYNTKKNLRQATLKITSVHSFLNDSDNSFRSCVNLYRTPILWGIYAMPADPVDYIEFCDDFCDDCVCWNQACPMWQQNKEFVELRKVCEDARRQKSDFIKQVKQSFKLNK